MGGKLEKASESGIKLPTREIYERQDIHVGLATVATSFCFASDDCPIEAWHDALIVTVEKGGVTPGGIIIPESAKEKTLVGVVVSVGPGRLPDSHPTPPTLAGLSMEQIEKVVIPFNCPRMPMLAKVGDTVIFPDLVGVHFMHDGRKYYAIHEVDVLARVKNR